MVRGHDLLRRTFAKREVVTLGEWRDSLRERAAAVWTDIRWHLIVAERNGRVVGVASGTYLGNVNTGVIGYLAVSPAMRGEGLGPRLRTRLRAMFRRDAMQVRRRALEAVVGEVKATNPWLQTLARRNRVVALDLMYSQPQLHPRDRRVGLVLYIEWLDRPRTRVATARIRKLLYTIWRRVYRIARPMADPQFQRMLSELAVRKWVGRVKLPAVERGPR